jgi:hypothetical protein
MTSILKVDTIQDQSGNNIINENADTITIGASGDTISIPSGATFDASNATVTIPAVDLTTGVTGTLPVANGGTNLTSGFANGITEADQWRLTADLTGTDAVISANLERIDTAGQGTLGTGMTESSGVFTFPSTGYWFVQFNGLFTNISAEDNVQVYIEATINNSTYAELAYGQDSSGGTSQNQCGTLYACTIVDVTSTSNVKVRFKTSSFSAASSLKGDTTKTLTGFTFIRLGDT